MSEKESQKEYLWNVHSYVNEYIRHADTKAELVVGWTSALLGVLVAGQIQKKFGCSLTGVASVTGVALLLGGFVTGFWTVLPRLSTTQTPGFIFWQNILAHKDKENFLSSFRNQSDDEMNGQVAGHLFDISNVADAKFKWVGLSIYLAFAGSLLSGITYMFG